MMPRGRAGWLQLPRTPPPGANNFSCKLTAAHPYPVVLVHGTLANMNDNWRAASPILANHGYCVFAFNYGLRARCPPGRLKSRVHVAFAHARKRAIGRGRTGRTSLTGTPPAAVT